MISPSIFKRTLVKVTSLTLRCIHFHIKRFPNAIHFIHYLFADLPLFQPFEQYYQRNANYCLLFHQTLCLCWYALLRNPDLDSIKYLRIIHHLEREPRTVTHVKRANMFDPMGWFKVPSVSRKWIAGRFDVGLSPQNNPLKSVENRGNKIGFYLCKNGQG